jgi:Activator of Hsp90 ATPase homolog 1-like protein
MGGKADKPENYNLVTYSLSSHENKTQVVLTQNNVGSEDELKHVTENWKAVLAKLKEVVEVEMIKAF